MKFSARRLLIEILAFTAFALLVAAGALAWRLSQGPIDLEMFRGQVERSLQEARGGQPVKIDRLALEWVRDRGRVEAVARGFTAMDKDREVTFRANRAMIALDAGSLFALKFKTQQLRLEDGAATVVRSADGVWTLADMVIAKEPDPSDKPFDPIRDINWTTLATPIRALISAGSFEQVELSNFRLDVDDRKSNNTWSANPVAGIWKANREGVSLTLNITLADAIPGEPNRISIALASDGQVERRGDRATAPYVFAGTHITRAELLRSYEAKRFSANIYWNTFASRGRLFGTVMNPFWMHVGDPAGRDEADAKLNLMGPGA